MEPYKDGSKIEVSLLHSRRDAEDGGVVLSLDSALSHRWQSFALPERLSACVCVSLSSAAIVSSEQNPVIIIAVVAVAGTIILVFMVFGFIIGRRYALAGTIDSPLL